MKDDVKEGDFGGATAACKDLIETALNAICLTNRLYRLYPLKVFFLMANLCMILTKSRRKNGAERYARIISKDRYKRRDMLELYRRIDISDWATVDQEHKRYNS